MRNFMKFSEDKHYDIEEDMVNYLSDNNNCTVKRIRKFVFNGVDITSKNFLTLAINLNHSKKIIQYLIDCGCDINDFNYNGDNALSLAIRMDRIDIVNILLKDRNIKINGVTNERYSPLMIAAMHGMETIADILLNGDAIIDKKYYNGNTALHLAVKTNHYNIVKKLINRGANINSLNNYNETPICFASNYNIIKILLNNKANPNHQDKKKNTLLHRLVQYGSISCIKLLIDFQANPLIENYHGFNVVQYARMQNKQHIVDILTKYSKFVKTQYRSMVRNILLDRQQEKNLDNLVLSFLF